MRPAVALLALLLLVPTAATAAPLPFERDLDIPPVVEDTGAPAQCTIAYLITDLSTNDTFLTRMRITPADNARPERNRMPCPSPVPPRLSIRALDVCTIRTEDPNNCVYTDMARGFEREPQLRNTASNTSRCRSDRANYIAMACWRGEAFDVCGVGCGQTADAARNQARQRCEEKHQRPCPITAVESVLVPP